MSLKTFPYIIIVDFLIYKLNKNSLNIITVLILIMQDDEIATYIGQKGYTIIKEYMSVEEQEFLRNDLTVKPFVPKNSLVKPPSFRVYRESKNKFYLPKFYGLENYGEPIL